MSHHNNLNIEECPLQNHSKNCKKRPKNLKGPYRVIRLCLFGIFLPALLIAIPLFMRYRVYGSQLYPLAMSDMRVLDNRVSTTWCQKQLIAVNTTFNAFLLRDAPKISPQLKPLTMVRHLVLEDDTKEYWGFYLLQGSSVTVSTCVRWPGASLIVIRGHKHLHECAYIGDDSSEELDEIIEAIREGTYQYSPPKNKSKVEAPSNEPDLMTRHRADVEFQNPLHQNTAKNNTIKHAFDTSDITDPKIMKALLEALQVKSKRVYTKEIEEEYLRTMRNSTIAKNENKNVKIQAPQRIEKSLSEEAYADIVGRLEDLGERGRNVLMQVNKKFQNPDNPRTEVGDGVVEQRIDMKGRFYSKPSVQFDDNVDKARRRRRDIAISNDLVKDDEENDLGVEEGFTPKPDGIADHRGTINETTLNDYSNSEFWSSFSSSEEALLNCAGLILNLPLTPHHKCTPDLSEAQAQETYFANTVTYKVPVNGYYFFVFNSENEVQPNYIRAQFNLQKTVYNVSDAVSSCINASSACKMDLNFFSSQKLVMELPVKINDTFWNEEYVVISECEPRTVVYALFVIAVPVIVILFAFS